MSGNINIAGLTPVDDPAYRYKMPRILAKVEGRGNGIKTVLVNVIDLGAALNRDAPEITKFFGCEVGTQSSFTLDSPSTCRAVINGSHNTADLQSNLTKYIENFVLCKNCHLPETYYKFKHGIISQKCNACGSVDPVDMTHKLTTFILAQHKKAKELAAKSDKKDKKDKKKSDEEAVVSGDKPEKVKKEKKDKSEKVGEDGEKKPKKEKKEKKDKTLEAAGDEDLDNGDDESDSKATGKF